MHYDPIMCMMVPDKAKDAGGFAPGSNAKIVTENEGSAYESFTVEYGGSPLKRGFKTKEAAKKYAEKQGLTVDAMTKDASFNVVYKSTSGTMQGLVMAGSEKEAEEKVRNREGAKFVSLIGVIKMSDSKKALDKAIRIMDEEWDKDGYNERTGLYKSRAYALKQASGDEVVVKVDGGYRIMSASQRNTWKKQR